MILYYINSAKLFFGIVLFIVVLQVIIKIIWSIPLPKSYYKKEREKRLIKLEKDMKAHLESFQITIKNKKKY